MNSTLETYERRLEAVRRLGRVKKYLSLCGIGVALWLDYLWGIVLEKVEATELRCDNLLMRLLMRSLCGSSGVKVSTVLKFVNGISFLIFIVFSAWLLYWAYMDTYVRKARGESSWAFSKKVALGAGVNLCIYVSLALATNYAFSS